MAMAMREAAGTLIADWRERGRNLGFGAGITQGYATLGQIGFSERSCYTAIGTVCNVAARLCAEVLNDSLLEEAGFEPSVPRDTPKFFDAGSCHLLDSLHAEKSARTRTDIMRMPAASRGTDGSNPVPSGGESTNFRIHAHLGRSC